MQIILASQSPRRKELLALLGHPFFTHPVDADERIPAGMEPARAVRMLSRRKAEAAGKRYPEALIIGADTVVAIDGRILGKPASREEAWEMLSLLSGRTHHVYTGVCLVRDGKSRTFVQCTRVEFYPLGRDEIARYLDTGEPFDKAGAYGIQGYGSLFVKEIAGDYFNVMGLPVARLAREMASFCPEWRASERAKE